MRKISEHIKVYNTDNTEFPSGHTANAFRGTEMVHQKLKWSHPVLSYSGYIVATGGRAIKSYSKEHFLSDLIAGAGLGFFPPNLLIGFLKK